MKPSKRRKDDRLQIPQLTESAARSSSKVVRGSRRSPRRGARDPARRCEGTEGASGLRVSAADEDHRRGEQVQKLKDDHTGRDRRPADAQGRGRSGRSERTPARRPPAGAATRRPCNVTSRTTYPPAECHFSRTPTPICRGPRECRRSRTPWRSSWTATVAGRRPRRRSRPRGIARVARRSRPIVETAIDRVESLVVYGYRPRTGRARAKRSRR